MRIKIALLFLFTCLSFSGFAEEKNYKGSFYDSENDIYFLVNLYSETITVPNFSFLGKINGYLSGNGIYGIWLITTFKENKKKAEIKFSNDLGSESQKTELTLIGDSIIQLNIIGKQKLKKVVNRKLFKLPNTLTFKRQY